MKLSACTIIMFVILSTATSCHKSNSGPSDNANVMFVHGCTPGVDLMLLDADASNNSSSYFPTLRLTENSGYMQLTPASGITLSFYIHGLKQLCSKTVDLVAGKHYSAFAGGSGVAPRFIFTTDDLTVPDSGYAKIRFINLCPDSMKVNCYVDSYLIAPNLDSMSYTQFIKVKPGNAHKIYMVDKAHLTDTFVADDPSMGLKLFLLPGEIRTYMLSGTQRPIGGTVSINLRCIFNR